MDQQSNLTIEIAVERLCSSFDRQCKCYTRLWEITKKAAGALAMSRGDFTQTLTVLEEKEGLLDEIMQAKTSVADEIAYWQENKVHASPVLAEQLEAWLDKIEDIIRRFLTAEKQLEKQITFYQKGMQ